MPGVVKGGKHHIMLLFCYICNSKHCRRFNGTTSQLTTWRATLLVRFLLSGVCKINQLLNELLWGRGRYVDQYMKFLPHSPHLKTTRASTNLPGTGGRQGNVSSSQAEQLLSALFLSCPLSLNFHWLVSQMQDMQRQPQMAYSQADRCLFFFFCLPPCCSSWALNVACFLRAMQC